MQATMVHHMSEGMVARYKKRAMAIMIQNNMSEIRCPCHRCNLRALVKPDSGTLEKHLLMSGFMKGYIDEDVNKGAHRQEMVTWEADEKTKSHSDMMKEMRDMIMMMTPDPMVVEKTQTWRHR
jgi:hypothetical protein